jgi:hypothetical protein
MIVIFREDFDRDKITRISEHKTTEEANTELAKLNLKRKVNEIYYTKEEEN